VKLLTDRLVEKFIFFDRKTMNPGIKTLLNKSVHTIVYGLNKLT